MKIKPKEPLTINVGTKETEEGVDNKLELLRHATSIHSRGVKSDVSSDFIYAKLEEIRREGIKELIEQACFQRRRVAYMIRKARQWRWDTEKSNWYRTIIPKWKREILQDQTNETFDAYTIGSTMVATLHRNVPKNPILKMVAGFQEDENIGEDKEEILDYIKEAKKKKKQRKEEE